MVRDQHLQNVSAQHKQNGIRLQTGDKTFIVSPRHAYAMAHTLFRTKRYEAAAKLLKAVASKGNEGPRISILLACCKAGMKDYAGCNDLLHKLFDTENEPVAESLQAAFIFDSVGMQGDAIRELLKVADEHPELPTVCLLLGDLMAAIGNTNKAAKCWRLAAKRDQDRGFVAQAAKKSLAEILKRIAR